MDERLRASFPQLRKPGKKEKSHAEIPPRSMTSGQLLAIFDRLVALKREKGDADFESRLRKLPPEDAVLLALDLVDKQRLAAEKAGGRGGNSKNRAKIESFWQAKRPFGLAFSTFAFL